MLNLAISSGASLDIIKALLTADKFEKINPEQRDRNGYTALALITNIELVDPAYRADVINELLKNKDVAEELRNLQHDYLGLNQETKQELKQETKQSKEEKPHKFREFFMSLRMAYHHKKIHALLRDMVEESLNSELFRFRLNGGYTYSNTHYTRQSAFIRA